MTFAFLPRHPEFISGSSQTTGNTKIATGLSAPRNDKKRGNVIASGTKQSRQTLLRHPDENQDLVGLGKIPD